MSRISLIADIVELRAWATDGPYSLSDLKEELESVLSDEEVEEAETLAYQIFEEFDRRQQLAVDGYPFSVGGFAITPNERKHNSSYLFCLGLVHFESIPSQLRTVEFESIVKGAAESYFCGTGIRIGAPWRTELVTEYRQLLEAVVELIPDLGAPSVEVAPAGGDGGWDILVVKNFADKKYSRTIALGNCATGRTDWEQKGQETAPNAFWEFFLRTPVDKNVCVTFVAVPFLMTDQDRTRKTWPQSISFDRLRICEHHPTASETVMQWLLEHRPEALDMALI